MQSLEEYERKRKQFAITSDNYFLIGHTDYENLVARLSEYLEGYPETRELMFAKSLVSRTGYRVYVLNQHQGPFKVKDASFIDAGSEEVIKEYLGALREGNLPDQIRVIKAIHGRPNLALFFRRK